ncbi:solute carrier family 22 member 15-like isoform X2 [Tubulanus polymorphus]|uniref:solute carrier family 22 member 15-like isoform X2 n=1 Tax=Tubulanus polymorphus TaxID=672921 RepID=UPI003DA5CF52
MEDENDRKAVLIDEQEKNQSAKRPTFDDIFKTVGESGPFQWLIFLGFAVLESVGATILVFFILEAGDPGWYCPNIAANATGVAYNLTTDHNATTAQPPPTLVKGVCYLGKPCANFTFDGQYTSTVTEWTLICDRAFISKSITSIFFVGVLIGAVLGGQLSDLFGRKMTLLVVWAVAMIGQTCSGFIPNWPGYAAVRFVTGTAAGIVAVTTVLMSEYLGPKWRTVIAYRLGWSIGPLFLSVAGYFIRDWRKLSLAIGLWTLPFYPIAIVYLPESARWLMQKQRFKEAERWIERMAKLNKKPCPDLSVLERIAEYEDEQRQHRQKYTYLDLFYSKKLALQSLSVMFGWFSCSVISYGIASQMSSFTGVIYYNMIIINVGTLSTRWIAIYVIKWLGRRRGYPLYMGLICLCMAAVLILDILGVDETRLSQTAISLAASIISTGAWAVALLYSTELYPTLMRNVSTGAGNMAARIGNIVAPQIALLESYHVAGPYALYGALALVSVIVLYVVLPETKGRPLPEDFPPRRRRNNWRQAETIELPSS